MSETTLTQPETPPAPRPLRLEDYAKVVGESDVHELLVLANRLKGCTVKMVNSTAVGGGVAEILIRLIPLMNEVGVPTQWDVMKGGEDFFAVTKAFHNALHGEPYEGRPEWFDTYLAVTESNRSWMRFDDDFVVIHDPQPAGLVQARDSVKNHWIWRCHIDLSRPNRQVWEFLRPFIERYDASLFSSPSFTQGLAIPQYLFSPTIDPLTDKNRDLEPEYVDSVLERFQLDKKRPILTQISRFDRLKDPLGVLRAYRIVRRYRDCQLVLAGGAADDDPEGAIVLAEVLEAAGNDPDIHIINLPPGSNLEINALQRGSTIVIQKSLREGFGLTVSEALWKEKPVVAAAVGGIPSQVLHKITGMLVHSVEGAAYQIRFLLSNPTFAKELGRNGREHVRENFLLTNNIKRYLLMMLILQQGS